MRPVIFLNPVNYSVIGDLRIEVSPASDIDGVSRRISRVRTLDGDAVISDFGFAEADRDLQFVSESMTQEEIDLVASWFRTHSTLVLCARTGAYLVSPDTMSVSAGQVSLRFMVSQRLDS
jgi:hypothetical protein